MAVFDGRKSQYESLIMPVCRQATSIEYLEKSPVALTLGQCKPVAAKVLAWRDDCKSGFFEVPYNGFVPHTRAWNLLRNKTCRTGFRSRVFML
jgi:hypothetical protein